VGDGLRLRLNSPERFLVELQKGLGGNRGITGVLQQKISNTFSKSMDLFRFGCFATVDEFSKIFSEVRPEQVQKMKVLMRFAFAFHNPEEKYHESDYYPFIQRLFDEDDLCSLKSNITVISYNYDCYLDYLLLRAHNHR